ncbi:MAG: UvrB/UvrC motif-containing protein [archaeon]|nr:UvrB/UvrC motif-containing protein [archaeon]
MEKVGEIKGASIGGNLERVVFDLKENEEGWVGARALEMHYGLDHFLYLDAPISDKCDESSGKIIYVKRLGPGKDDFFVDLSKAGDYLWERYFIDKESYEELLEDPGIGVIKYEKKKTLEEELYEAVKKDEFETAAKLRDKIKYLKK